MLSYQKVPPIRLKKKKRSIHIRRIIRRIRLDLAQQVAFHRALLLGPCRNGNVGDGVDDQYIPCFIFC